MNTHLQLCAAMRSAAILVFSVAAIRFEATPVIATEYGVSTVGQGNEINHSPTPVSVTGSQTFGDPNGTLGYGSLTGLAGAGPGLANGVAVTTGSSNANLSGAFNQFTHSSTGSYYDEVIINGPPGTPPGTPVDYSINLFVTAYVSANVNKGAPGDDPSAGATIVVRIPGLDSSLEVRSDGFYQATGIFSSLPQQFGQATSTTTPIFHGQTGSTIAIGLGVDAQSRVTDSRWDYGPGGSTMYAKASCQVTFLGLSVFNLPDGYDANSTDGTIVHNQLAGASNSFGDYDGDGIADASDYVVWRKTADQLTGARYKGADGNGNSFVDLNDFDYWRNLFGQTAGSGAGASINAAVPEPASVVLLMLAMTGVSLRRCGAA